MEQQNDFCGSVQHRVVKVGQLIMLVLLGQALSYLALDIAPGVRVDGNLVPSSGIIPFVGDG